MGRPKKQIKIDPADAVEAMASVGANDEEIADFLGVTSQTVRNRFLPFLTKGRAELRLSLREAQIDRALAGNVPMLIWLGKQMLGQRDKTEITGADGSPLLGVSQDLKRLSIEERRQLAELVRKTQA